MTILCKIDNRERDLIQIIDFPICKDNLEIGDIQIIEQENEIEKLLVLIERKSYKDLSSSIKDGRYKEQKNRILHSIPSNIRKIYLLEGNAKEFKLPKSVLQGTILNTILRDNLHVYFTKNINETVEWIKIILKNIDKYKETILSDKLPSQSSDSLIHIVKKKNMNAETCFTNMICGIPGVSSKIADVFLQKYKTIGNMMKIFIHEMEGEKEKIMLDLENIKVGSNSRKLGSKHALTIYEFLFK